MTPPKLPPPAIRPPTAPNPSIPNPAIPNPSTPTPSIPNPSAPTPAIPDPDRYSRQILFPGIGAAGQQALASARVAIVGVGATGAASASLLARAGVGHLTLIDRDFVEPSNLQRQILFDEQDAADSLPKAEAARRKLLSFNSSIAITAHIADLVPANIHTLLASAHVILDATDNFETRYLLNDFAVQQGIPWIYAAAVGAYAATMTILPKPISPMAVTPEAPTDPEGPSFSPNAVISTEAREHSEGAQWRDPRISPLPPSQSDASPEPGDAPPPYAPTACLACLFPTPPSGPVETCDTAGILSTAVNLAASLQVTETLKLLTGHFDQLRRTLVSFNLWQPTAAHRLDHAEISTAHPRLGCEVCDHRRFTHLAGAGRPHITLCGRDSVQIHEHHRPVDLVAMRDRLAHHPDLANLRANSLLLRFRRGPYTVTLFGDGRALIHGTTDITIARNLYARFIGS